MVAVELMKVEMRKNWIQLLITFLILSFFTPLNIWSQHMNYHSYEFVDFLYMEVTFIFIVLIIALALVQIGSERSNGILVFTCSLPYSRAQIYLTKCFLGLSVILIGWLLSFTLTGLILRLNEMQTTYFIEYYLDGLGALLLFYAITISAGAFTGTAFAQGLVTITVSILPLLLVLLTIIQLDILFNLEIPLDDKLKNVYSISPVSYLSFDSARYSELYMPFLLACLFLIVGYFAFIKHPIERTGSFFTWKSMNRPVQIIVIFIGVIGFSAFGYLTDERMLGYLIGGGIGAFIGFIVSYYLIFKKKK